MATEFTTIKENGSDKDVQVTRPGEGSRNVSCTESYDPYSMKNAQDTIYIILWGAAGAAMLIVAIKMFAAGIKVCRRHYLNSTGNLNAENNALQFEENPPPNYSQISMRTLPPTYSQGCRITHYHPSTGNTSTGNESATRVSEHDVGYASASNSFVSDFSAPSSQQNENASSSGIISSLQSPLESSAHDDNATENISESDFTVSVQTSGETLE